MVDDASDAGGTGGSALSNYRDVSLGNGFQFEFSCGNCARTWKSPYKAYRRGQIASLLYRISHHLPDRGRFLGFSNLASQGGMRGARESALRLAQEAAAEQFNRCPGCTKVVCQECWDSNSEQCVSCRAKGGHQRSDRAEGHAGARVSGASARDSGDAALRCPNCSTSIDGGRFCPECGFDMASTHKSCPSCATMCPRVARFCTDCGHAF